MSYYYPEQDTTQVPAFGSQLYWADDGEEEVDYSPDALDYPQASSTSAHDLPPVSSKQKESSSRSSKSSRHHKRKESKTSYQSGSDTERESSSRSGGGNKSKMSGSRSAKHQHSGSTSRGRDKAPKPSSRKSTDDWSDVADPEERRRIQNKIAQRKFREKKKEEKEQEQRDRLNQQHASLSYRIPSPEEIPSDQGDLSGVPWGGIGMGMIMAKGHAASASQAGGGVVRDGRQYSQSSDPSTAASATVMDTSYLSPYGGGYAAQMGNTWGGGGGSTSPDGGSSYGYAGSTSSHHYPGAYYAGGGGGGSSGEEGNSPYLDYHVEYDAAGGDGSSGYHM